MLMAAVDVFAFRNRWVDVDFSFAGDAINDWTDYVQKFATCEF
jgi:hypothetical protein